MTEIDNDKLLKDFFAENKREIADNGFSRRVMHHLPDRSNRPRSEINHHCNGRPTVHGRTESSINGITMLVTLCAKGLAQL